MTNKDIAHFLINSDLFKIATVRMLYPGDGRVFYYKDVPVDQVNDGIIFIMADAIDKAVAKECIDEANNR